MSDAVLCLMVSPMLLLLLLLLLRSLQCVLQMLLLPIDLAAPSSTPCSSSNSSRVAAAAVDVSAFPPQNSSGSITAVLWEQQSPHPTAEHMCLQTVWFLQIMLGLLLPCFMACCSDFAARRLFLCEQRQQQQQQCSEATAAAAGSSCSCSKAGSSRAAADEKTAAAAAVGEASAAAGCIHLQCGDLLVELRPGQLMDHPLEWCVLRVHKNFHVFVLGVEGWAHVRINKVVLLCVNVSATQ
jgi:hypothetical protein